MSEDEQLFWEQDLEQHEIDQLDGPEPLALIEIRIADTVVLEEDK